MGDRGWYWLIGAKIACCGALVLVLTGVLSLAAIGAFLSGNALPLAGGGILLSLFLARRWLPVRHAGHSKSMGARK
jgi:ABC-type transport system involved in cytochrome c biogenesis permease component|tara:strand:- start:8389 stop:8616 length:228 start_codon:yes stop_codon:yes gene_type:complete